MPEILKKQTGTIIAISSIFEPYSLLNNLFIMTANGKGHLPSAMENVFPESHLSLAEADPEIYSIIEDEKRRQW